jgi:hypothetical protein
MQSVTRVAFVLALGACQVQASDPGAEAPSPLDGVPGDHAELAPGPVARPRLIIHIAGTGIGEVRVADVLTGEAVATCTHSCLLRPSEGQQLEILAATPSIDGVLSGACSSPGPSCEVTIGAGLTVVTATFKTDPKEQWTLLPGGGPIPSAAFDGSGNLIVVSGGITKLSPAGAVVWQVPVAACVVATGPGDTIYAQTATTVTRLAPDGSALWSQPLDPHAVGCGNEDGFVHNLAVGSDGAVAIHGNTGVARWDGDGNFRWAAAVNSLGEYGVAIEPDGAVDVAVLSDEPIDLVRFAADGTPLDPIEHITAQYHGMFVVDPGGRRLAAASGHSHTDAFGYSVRLPDPDFAPTGICSAGVDDVAWVYQTDDDTFFARDWTVNRYRADRSLLWSYHHPIEPIDFFEEIGTTPFDIAGAPDGRIAIVGSFAGATYFGGWIATFGP